MTHHSGAAVAIETPVLTGDMSEGKDFVDDSYDLKPSSTMELCMKDLTARMVVLTWGSELATRPTIRRRRLSSTTMGHGAGIRTRVSCSTK